MFVLGPTNSSSPVHDSKSTAKDGNFGGNRQVTSNIQDAADYKKASTSSKLKVENPVDETVRDVDDMNDPAARKREETRRAEVLHDDNVAAIANRKKSSGEILEDVDGPAEDTTPVAEDDARKHGSRNKWHFGEDHNKPEDQNLYTP